MRVNRQVLELARNGIAVGARVRVLDAGCGPRPFERLFPAAHYIGLDISVEQAPNVLGDNAAMPFSSNCFDLVIASETLEHTQDYEAAARELVRVAKSGGLVFVSIPFLYPVHGAPHDYQRLTELKLRALFGACEIVEFRVSNSIFTTWLIMLEIAVTQLSAAHRLFALIAKPAVFGLNIVAVAIDSAGVTAMRTLARFHSPALVPSGKRWSDEVLRTMPVGYVLLLRKPTAP